MKKLLFLATAFCISAAAMAQSKTDELIKVSVDSYNFGKIKQGVPVTTYFTITNISDKPVMVESATAGCGCTTPEVSKAPFAPKSSVQLKVGYNAGSVSHFDKDVTIKLAGTQDVKIVKITGDVLDEAAYAAYMKTDEFKKDEQAKAKAAKAIARADKGSK